MVILVSDEDDCSVHDRNLSSADRPELGERSSFRCFEHGVYCGAPDTPRTEGTKQNCVPRPGPGSGEPHRSRYMTSVDDYVAFLVG